jgi:hypothetical protein
MIAEIERRQLSLDGYVADVEQFGIAAFPLDAAQDVQELLALIATSIVERRGWPAYDKTAKEYECHDGRSIRGVKSIHRDTSTPAELAERIQKSFVVKFPIYFPCLQTI